jgi:hypothetical protein
MNKQAISPAIWATMIKRYIVMAAVGAVICVYFFYRMYAMPVSQTVPMWMVVGASIGGLLTTTGLFGVGLNLILQIVGKK